MPLVPYLSPQVRQGSTGCSQKTPLQEPRPHPQPSAGTALCPVVVPFSGCHTSGIIHDVAFGSGFFPGLKCICNSSMLLCVLILCFFLLLSSIPWCGCSAVSFPIDSFPVWGDYNKVAINTEIDCFFCMTMFLILLDKYLGLGLLGHISVCLTW